jgi:hypothetical protein
MAVTHANYVFLPWVRQGMAAGIQTPDSLSAQQAWAVTVPVTEMEARFHTLLGRSEDYATFLATPTQFRVALKST